MDPARPKAYDIFYMFRHVLVFFLYLPFKRQFKKDILVMFDECRWDRRHECSALAKHVHRERERDRKRELAHREQAMREMEMV